MRGYLSLGSNIGDRRRHLEAALKKLRQAGVQITAVSHIYETRAVEVSDSQENYYNLAAAIEYEGSPHDLLRICRRIEDELGRQRPYPRAPRTIDIDILLLEGMRLSTPDLEIPHPRMECRAFVIFPLSEVAPGVVLPSGRDIIEVKKSLPHDEIARVLKKPHDG
ncbi:MAG: 2-amino-4-hydroxy-6-hydroxymethyldihydropteridine diphosphokinase [Desulfomonilia bacterium]|jgi:2-amino-4-hydroxy-6-hydroxymethyldihydropteridine diphosphokinase|uniref:2-amino-4-hydroxy-6-hydroxymethyldihydropteridine diphosphokinase n=1 Tax=anaerobic digester metagenome TaxID=1263854 RepID=A0A485LXT2_9ZZZZ|nr:2-amino-4-hydroxy-6-hydroxymethyldihydropteridine diphosphokinase [Pseudomonadota bacterium]HON37579.1 2-amino-4-hydroxy-6-hydroxymethyldihydropteridine diphosphokinase [Deltaproteobacteria bacterium]HRS55086.1 2-amino-4-hydroxy-6-hydroxymethyldihydropteridine diphosphokinase [Desulfomonilia bacterium]HPD21437.1 2-amino-4-hydroxy-6-hydroxymethyldihydropteridine diphosphokinase [Deltaproteobacteria bacterium]HPX51377.1 2-amino-4-hydroxy-6-hydroxymethyldihydropteridine diphosphokinase [Deltapr